MDIDPQQQIAGEDGHPAAKFGAGSVAPLTPPAARGERVAPPRSVVLREGERPREVFALRDGWAMRYWALPDGRRQILSFLLPGELLCFQALSQRPMPCSVGAVTKLRLQGHGVAALIRRIAVDSDLAHRFDAMWAAELAVAYERATDLGRRTAHERIARLVVDLYARVGDRSTGDTVGFPLRQEHIADAVGLTPVHVCRTLAAMRADGLFTLLRQRLTIGDWDRLLDVAGRGPGELADHARDTATVARLLAA